MHASTNFAHVDKKLSADTVLWLSVGCTGFVLASVLGAAHAIWGNAWLLCNSQDAFAFGFALPAWAAFTAWMQSLRAPSHIGRAAGSSASAQLACAVYVCAALALGFAQGYAGRAWITGEISMSLSIAVGAAALSPLTVWRVRPTWLRIQEQT